MKQIIQKRIKAEKKDLAHFFLEGLPPTTNTIYSKRFGAGKGMFLNAKGESYKKEIVKFIDNLNLILPENTQLEIQIGYFVCDGKSYKEAQLLKFDVEGRHKILIDAIMESCKKRCQIDDKWFITASLYKQLISESTYKDRFKNNTTEVKIKSIEF